MYVIVVYDMEADRTHLMLKLCRRYLVHVQNSVLEGKSRREICCDTEGEIEDLLQEGESVMVYELSSDQLLNRTVYGDDPTEDSRFL